jgi:hypothetical protein
MSVFETIKDFDIEALEYTSLINNLKSTNIKITLKKLMIKNGK